MKQPSEEKSRPTTAAKSQQPNPRLYPSATTSATRWNKFAVAEAASSISETALSCYPANTEKSACALTKQRQTGRSMVAVPFRRRPDLAFGVDVLAVADRPIENNEHGCFMIWRGDGHGR